MDASIEKKKKQQNQRHGILHELFKHHPAPPQGPTDSLTVEEGKWVEKERLLFDDWLIPLITNAQAKEAHARRA